MSRKQNPIIERFDRFLATIDQQGDPHNSPVSAPKCRPIPNISSPENEDTYELADCEPTRFKEGQPVNSDYSLDPSVPNTSLDEHENLPACFTPGTRILTPIGERPIEDLEVGDNVVTRDNGALEISWIGRKNLTGEFLELNPHHYPILIKEGSLANYLPERDMWVSPQHRILFSCEEAQMFFEEREVLVAAQHLTRLKGVQRADCDQVTYIYLMFEGHELVLSNGLWSESFQTSFQALCGIEECSRNEILEAFPDLATQAGTRRKSSTFRTLNRLEADLLFTQGNSLF